MKSHLIIISTFYIVLTKGLNESSKQSQPIFESKYKKDYFESIYVNTAISQNAELHCNFSSNPPPDLIVWSKKFEAISDDNKYQITKVINQKHGHHSSVLKIKNIRESDITYYRCNVQNDVGYEEFEINLTLYPTPITLVKHEYDNGTLKTIWSVESIQPLTEFKLLWKNSTELNSKKWERKTALINVDNRPDGKLWTVNFELKIPEGGYTVSAEAKNTEGWTDFPSEATKIIIAKGVSNSIGTLVSPWGQFFKNLHKMIPNPAIL